MAIEVSKRSGTSLIGVIDRVKEVVASEQKRLPQALRISYIADQAPETRSQISTLQGNISTAMFLVLTVVVAAVGVKSGLLVAFGIRFHSSLLYFRERAGLHLQLHGDVWNAAWAWNADRWCHCCGRVS